MTRRRVAASFCVVVESLESRRLLAADSAHVLLAERLVNELTPTVNAYGSPATVTWAGLNGATKTTNESVCSSFITALLTQAYGFNATQFSGWTGSTNPLAKNYYDAIAASKGFTGYSDIDLMEVGDLFSIKYIDGSSDTGHLVMVDAPPTLVSTTATERVYNLTIIDSTGSTHGTTDTRRVIDPATGEYDTGVGRGVMRVYTDLDGNLTRYSWSTSSASVIYSASMGRLPIFGKLPPTSVNAPTSLAATTVSQTRIDLAWTDTAGNEDGFVVQRSLNGGTSWSTLAVVGPNVTSYADTACVAGTTYTYRLYATYGNIKSGFSNVATAKTLTNLPLAPSNLTATPAGKGKMSLAWKDNSGIETGFKIERSTNGGTFVVVATLGKNVVKWTDTSVKTGTTYTYRVRAYNTYGNSLYSNTATATASNSVLTSPLSSKLVMSL